MSSKLFQAETVDRKLGRLEVRTIKVSTEMNAILLPVLRKLWLSFRRTEQASNNSQTLKGKRSGLDTV